MTFTYKSKNVNGHYIQLFQNKFESVYRVEVYPVIDKEISLCGYPISKKVYKAKEKALKGFYNAVHYYGKL